MNKKWPTVEEVKRMSEEKAKKDRKDKLMVFLLLGTIIVIITLMLYAVTR